MRVLIWAETLWRNKLFILYCGVSLSVWYTLLCTVVINKRHSIRKPVYFTTTFRSILGPSSGGVWTETLWWNKLFFLYCGVYLSNWIHVIVYCCAVYCCVAVYLGYFVILYSMCVCMLLRVHKCVFMCGWVYKRVHCVHGSNVHILLYCSRHTYTQIV